jgi:Head domain of trimeric autotransporter adhesin
MKKLLLIFSALIFSVNVVNAQLGVGTPLPAASSQLDVVSTNKGILIPRVSLTGTTDATTISNGNVNSLLVFNTQTTSDVTPGYYYWYTNKWNRMDGGGTETITTLVDNGNGTITYTNESGTATTVNIAAMIKNNETLTSQSFVPATGILTYNDEKGIATNLNLSAMVPNFETLTSQSFVPATGILTYNDEKGIATNLDLSAMVPNFETLTSQSFVPATGILTYNDEKGIATNLNLSAMIPNFETLTSQSFVPATGILTYNDEKGVATNLDLSVLKLEPWQVELTTDKATLNTQNIYQLGHVGIGTNSILPGVAFDNRGALRSGSDHTGTVGINSVAFGSNNTSAGINSVAVGSFTQANEEESFAGGRSSSVAVGAYDGFAYGYANQANGPQSAAFGAATKANGYRSFTNGNGSIAPSYAETVIGNYNAITTGNPLNITATDPLFQIGNGNSNGSFLSNAVTVLKNGNTGIGIPGVEAAAKPTERLDIGSGNLRVRDINTNVGAPTDNVVVADATGILKTVTSASFAGNNWQATGNTGTTAGTNFIGTTDAQDFVVKTNNAENLRVTQTGNVGIGTPTPTNKVEITSAAANTSGLTFTNLNSATPGDATVTTPLGVNAAGTVVAMLPDTRYAIRTITADYTVTLTDETILADGTAGPVIITFPVSVTITGKRYNIKKIAGAGTITVISAPGTTILGNPSMIANNNILQYDGISNWVQLN